MAVAAIHRRKFELQKGRAVDSKLLSFTLHLSLHILHLSLLPKKHNLLQIFIMSGYSNVGNRGVYEAGDQRNVSEAERKAEESDPYNEGKENSHNNLDSKDERSIANRLAAEEKKSESGDDTETAQLKKDPTLPARAHGNEPSKGAKIDAQLQAEEEEELKRKGKA
ncbi:unnamed protein product [Fusarium graminearum]|nr:unnamed protein product [Fusarium graminearum]CAG2007049.1 unnamed protein product [Fusarium graminearum]